MCGRPVNWHTRRVWHLQSRESVSMLKPAIFVGFLQRAPQAQKCVTASRQLAILASRTKGGRLHNQLVAGFSTVTAICLHLHASTMDAVKRARALPALTFTLSRGLASSRRPQCSKDDLRRAGHPVPLLFDTGPLSRAREKLEHGVARCTPHTRPAEIQPLTSFWHDFFVRSQPSRHRSHFNTRCPCCRSALATPPVPQKMSRKTSRHLSFRRPCCNRALIAC